MGGVRDISIEYTWVKYILRLDECYCLIASMTTAQSKQPFLCYFTHTEGSKFPNFPNFADILIIKHVS